MRMNMKLFLNRNIFYKEKKNIYSFLLIIFFLIPLFSYSQHYQDLLNKRIIDKPFGKIIEKNSINLNTEIYPAGGLLVETYYGISEKFAAGISFGGNNIIGYSTIKYNKYPGFYAIFELLEDSPFYPSIHLGLETQGSGYYSENYNRFQFLQPGIFFVISKYFDWEGKFIISFGINRTVNLFENKDEYKNLDAYLGLQKNIGKWFLINLEYDCAFNDNDKKEFGQGKGYLNLGFSFRLFKDYSMIIKFNIKDILRNNKIGENFRTIGFNYIWFL